MATNVYEGMFIFDSAQYARDAAGVARKVDEMIKGIGGELLASRLWEERRLAYPIKGQRKGAYWLTYFRVDPSQLTVLNRQCLITDNILRHLFLKVDPRLVETLVSHITSEHPATPKPEPVAVKVVDDDEEEDDAVVVDAVDAVDED